MGNVFGDMPDGRLTPLVIAHRGAWDPAPQNSLAAFEQAIADGADAVELDVRRTADGRLVVVHDPRVGLRALHRLAADDVRARMAPGQAPGLGDVLGALAGRVKVDVELKEDGYVPEALDEIARHLEPSAYVVTSFLDRVLVQVREAAPGIRTGLLLAPRRSVKRLEHRVADTCVDLLAPHVALTRGGFLGWAADRGLPAWVWTVNDPRMLRDLFADPRVEAVITDRARLAVREARATAGPDLPAVA